MLIFHKLRGGCAAPSVPGKEHDAALAVQVTVLPSRAGADYSGFAAFEAIARRAVAGRGSAWREEGGGH
jgi:hypothetical protein